MLTKETAKRVKQLHEKKHRTELKLFLVEGEKAVAELLTSDFVITDLFITSLFYEKYRSLISKHFPEYTLVEQQEIENIGTLETNDSALAIVNQKKSPLLTISPDEIILTLDTIRDPGNLGAIMRIADWYGITKIVASATTTDFYNTKTIATSMGSFTRVSLYYRDLYEVLRDAQVPILGAFLQGEDVHTFSFPQGGILLMGNESNGISESLSSLITHKISIPKYGNAESLNVSTATAIILDNWKRSV